MRFQKNPKKLGLFFIIVIFLITFHYLGFLKSVEHFTRSFFSPVLNYSTQLKQNATSSSTTDAVISTLNNRISVLTAQNYLLTSENENLKKSLDFRSKKSGKYVSVRIMGKESSNSDDVLVIDRGLESGIQEGDPALNEDGLFVGKIFKPGENQAFVRLLSHSESKITGQILNKDKSIGVVEGGFGLSLKMKFIPRNETLQVGDQVVSSGLDSDIPAGYLVGTIAVVENEAYKPFQQAIISPAANLSKLSLLNILTKQ